MYKFRSVHVSYNSQVNSKKFLLLGLKQVIRAGHCTKISANCL
jgi:hypothetical protein